MESEILNEKVEWEARRVAAAFGVSEWEIIERDDDRYRYWGMGRAGRYVRFVWLEESASRLTVGESTKRGYMAPKGCCDWHDYGPLGLGEALNNDLMAKGCYCLNYDYECHHYEDVWAFLPPLSMHEKLELHLLMPRELWPQKWLDEADAP